MSFKQMLETPRAAEVVAQEQELPPAWRASQERKPDGSAVLVTGPLPDTQEAVDEYLETHGFAREYWMMKPGTGVLSKNWDALRRVWNSDIEDYETQVRAMASSRVEVVPRSERIDIEELLDIVGEKPPAKSSARKLDGDDTFAVLWSDFQGGKFESDLEVSMAKFKDCMIQAANDFMQSGMANVHLAGLGDDCEGIVSQGGKNMWRTTLTITEQVRLMRRLYLWVIDLFLDAGAQKITAVTVASNHGQAQRVPVETRADDDWGIEAMVSVAEALEINPDRYGNVHIYVPGPDEANVTLELSGLVVAHSHGHLFYKGNNTIKSVFDWWQGCTFSGLPEGQATLLVTGHGHHLEMAERSGRTWLMLPASELESNWWKLRTGQTGDPGIVTMKISNGQWTQLKRIRARD